MPEKVEKSDPPDFISSSIPKWFPALAKEKFEVMRAHRIGPERNTGLPRIFMVKMLRFTDRDKLLKASRDTPVMIAGKEIRFAADYSNYTAKSRLEYAQAMKSARKQGFYTFLLYPAKLKLTNSAEVHLFQTHMEAEDFISSIQTAEL